MTSLIDRAGWSPARTAQLAALEDSELLAARVVADHRKQYDILLVGGRGRAVSRRAERHLRPVVGDWVAVRAVGADRYVIEGVLPRRTELVRKAAGGRSRPQVLVSNVDVVAIVTSPDRDFNLRRLERYLQVVRASGAEPVIVLNKCDLVDDVRPLLDRVIGVRAYPTSTVLGVGLDALRREVSAGRTAVLVGSSGVGKSSLVNALLGGAAMRVNAISDVDGRGQHTTTHRQLHLVPDGGVLIDVPGMRELGLWDDPSALDAVFDDVGQLAERCAYRDCSHRSEPGCAIAAAVDAGELDAARVRSYRKLKRELAHERARAERRTRSTKNRRSKVRKRTDW